MRHIKTEHSFVVQERRRGELAKTRGEWADLEWADDLEKAQARLAETIEHAAGDPHEWRDADDFRLVLRATTTLESTLFQGSS